MLLLSYLGMVYGFSSSQHALPLANQQLFSLCLKFKIVWIREPPARLMTRLVGLNEDTADVLYSLWFTSILCVSFSLSRSHIIILVSPWLPLEVLCHLCPQFLLCCYSHYFWCIFSSRRAIEELLKETDRARVRAETMGPAGWWAMILKCHPCHVSHHWFTWAL